MTGFAWTLNRTEAKQEQQILTNLLKLSNILPDLQNFKSGAAIGTAYEENTKRAFAVAVLFNKYGKCSANTIIANEEVDFPYVPGLLAFRVGPAICSVLDNIIDQVDLLIIDGQGIAHERGLGLASHIGILYNKPSIGVTRNILYGKYTDPPNYRFAHTHITNPKNKIIIGYALSLGEKCSPCYFSPGHNIDIQTAFKILCNISGKSCFPFPVQRAHSIANGEAKKFWKKRKNDV